METEKENNLLLIRLPVVAVCRPVSQTTPGYLTPLTCEKMAT